MMTIFKERIIVKRLMAIILAVLLTFSLFVGLTRTTFDSMFASAEAATAKMMYFRYYQVNESASFKMLFPCEPGKKYLLSYKIKTSGAGDYDILAESYGGSVVSFAGRTEGEDFTQTVKVNVTSGEKFSFVIVPKKNANGNYLYFDGYIADVVMLETDDEYKPKNDVNVASGFGNFSNWNGTKCANLIKYRKADLYSVYNTSGFSTETGKLFEYDANYFKSDAKLNNTFFVKPGTEWFYIWQYVKLEPNKTYELSYNWKVEDGKPGCYLLYYTNSENRLKPENGNCTCVVDDDINKTTYRFSTPSNLRADENLTFAPFTSTKSDSFYFGNPEIYELDAEGNRIGRNFIVDGTFSQVDNSHTDTAQSAWFFQKKTSWEVSFKEDSFFENKKPRRIDFDGAKGDFSQFATVEENQFYAFSFNFKFADMTKEPEPIIEYYTNNGSQKADIIDSYTEENEYKVTYRFKVPEGLREKDNIRVGIKLPADGSNATFAEFSLKKASADGENILNNPLLATKKDIIVWNTENIEKWLLNGNFPEGSWDLRFYNDGYFRLSSENLLIGRGQSTRSQGLWGMLLQDITLTPGSNYIFSFKAKFANTGNKVDSSGTEYNNMGPSVLYYCKSKGKDMSLSEFTVEEDPKEYKTTYKFKMPTDTRIGQDNFTVRIILASDYVSGYFTGLELYEVDGSNQPVGDNMIKNGSFETGDLSSWNQSGQFSTLLVRKIPENFFSKVSPAKDCMLKYRNPSSWANMTQDLSLKSNTKYVVYSKQMHTTDDPANPARITFQAFFKEDNKVSFIPSEKTVDEKTGLITQTFTTPELVYGYNLKMFLYIINTENAGYWGPIEVYELDENDKPIGNQLLLNNNFVFGQDCWEVSGTTVYRKCEVPDGFFATAGVSKEKMIYSKGTANDQAFGQNVQLQHGKTYVYSGYYVNMNADGVTPQIRYLALDGTYKTMKLEGFYDTNSYYFEAEFTLPDDAKFDNGYASVKAEMFNSSKGKGYFCNLMLFEDGKYENILSDAQFKNSLKNWNTTNNFTLSNYDPEVFVFYYDDEKFDDGNWSGQVTAMNVGKGSLRGNLLDTNNRPVKGAEILLTDDVNSYSAVTDAQGEFSFASIPADMYSLYVIYNNDKEFCTTINISAGSSMVIENIRFVLEVDDDYDYDFDIDTSDTEVYEEETGPLDFGMVSGKYYDINSENPEGEMIYFGTYVKVLTDKNGEFKVSKIPEGEYEVYIVKNGKKKVLKSIKVLNGKSIRLVLREKPEESEEQDYLWLILVIAGGVLLVAGGVTSFIVIRKVKKKQ